MSSNLQTYSESNYNSIITGELLKDPSNKNNNNLNKLNQHRIYSKTFIALKEYEINSIDCDNDEESISQIK